jgi:hypothetical protein
LKCCILRETLKDLSTRKKLMRISLVATSGEGNCEKEIDNTLSWEAGQEGVRGERGKVIFPD